MNARAAWAAAAALMVLHVVLALAAARRLGTTNDEPVGIAGGFALLTRHEMKINFEHPPLVKALAALPLLGFHPPIDPGDPDYAAGREWAYARRFLFESGRDPDSLLFRARCGVVGLSALLGLAIFAATASIYGHRAALLPLCFYAFDPAFLGHAPIVQFDVGLSLFVFVSAMAFHAALREGRKAWYLVAGACLGLGLATKFTALYLLPIWVALVVMERRQLARRTIVGLAIASVAAGSALLFCYGVVLAADLVRGLVWQLQHAARGHVSYFMGAVSARGSVLYFPVVAALKTPLETLAAFLLALVVALKTGIDRRVGGALVAGATFFVLLLPSSIDIGHRYMLPVYPFLYVALGSLASPATGWRLPSGASRWWQSAALGLALLLALRSVAIFPDYLGNTNLIAGKEPERYLADSSLDWGQDLPRLSAYLRQRGNPEIGLAYEGMDSPEHRGIRFHRAPCARTPGLYAVSVDCVVGISPAWDRGCYGWLRSEAPVARIGTSMLIVEVMEKPR